MNVPFEMAQGFAVTYGDTLLGKPTSDFTGSTGITEIKHPQLWDHGIIPYTIKPDVPNPQRIQQAIEVFNQRTSVKFVPYEGQADALVFEKGEEHCYSYLGKIGGLQPLFLSDRCAQAQIEHELMHALGFIHEQSRTDRDQFIDVLWPNIEEKYQSQFAIVPDALMDYYFDSPFDPDSIMMYDSHAFAVKPELTTLKIKNTGAAITPRTDLDESDVQRVNRLYHHSP